MVKYKDKSYQTKVCNRILELLMAYKTNEGERIFEKFKGNIFLNAKQSIPSSKYPALFIFIAEGSREPLAIKRQDWWNLTVKVMIYTLDHSENDMDDHYIWAEGLDRVFRVNPRATIEGKEDLQIHKADLQDWKFNFAFGDEFLISETEATVAIKTKLCLANQIS